MKKLSKHSEYSSANKSITIPEFLLGFVIFFYDLLDISMTLRIKDGSTCI